MSRNSEMVQICWDAIDAFLTDWQVNPYLWSHEIDVQVEIATRLKIAFQKKKVATIRGNYGDALPGFEGNQIWSRVCCEPPIQYIYSDGEKYTCYPDIIVWDDVEDPDSPPDAIEGNFPVLWACEIKYNNPVYGDFDVEKLKYLVNQRTALYGCWLNMTLARTTTGDGIEWRQDLEGGRVRICNAMLPEKLQNSG